jgi:tetratricopeptide (TPR) repeat protein
LFKILLFLAHFASLTLAWIYAFFYDQYDVTFQILVQEIEAYPNSAIVAFTYGYVLRKEGKLQESSEYFLRAKEYGGDVPEFQLKIEYELGCNYYLQLQWEPALQHLTHFLANYQSEGFRTYCAYQIGFCHAILGNNEQAAVFMKKVQPWVRKVIFLTFNFK